MSGLQDVFWTGFSDEVEKLAVSLGTVGKGLGTAGVLGLGAAAMAGGDEKSPKKTRVGDYEAAHKGYGARIKAQMDAANE
jgi:hypothetical protein